MDLQFDNTKLKRKNPIKRNHKFFGRDEYNLEMEFAYEYMEQDANQTIILYRVDLSKTKVNDIYKEADKDAIRYLPPVEVPCVYEIQEAEQQSYDKNKMKGLYAKPGKLIFSVLLKTMDELGIDIRRGDYVGIDIDEQTRFYWTVTNDGRVGMTANKNTIYGVRPYFRTIECAPADNIEFNG